MTGIESFEKVEILLIKAICARRLPAFRFVERIDTQGIESIYAERFPIWAWEGRSTTGFPGPHTRRN